ncbi:MAG TPA: hypothetical protein VKI41_03435 [Vicinamibacteria bacterium]|nr:hypothetical protein [Vicinamibacteria bacterium]
MPRATAATELVSRALEGDDDALSEGAANETLDEISKVRADLRGLGARLAELRSQLDTLGPATLAVEHIVAYWLSRDPANRKLGETPERLEEQLVLEMSRRGSANWKLLHEDQAGPDSTAWQPRPPQLQAGVERHILYWEGRTSPAQYGQVQVSPSKERRIRSFAACNGCKPRVALEALLDFALSAAGEPGVSASQVEDIKAALAELRYILEGLRTQLLALARDTVFVGELVSGLAPLLSLLCTQDPGIRHPALQGGRLRMEPAELYARLSAYISSQAASRWDVCVQSPLGLPGREGRSVEDESVRRQPTEGEDGGEES